MTSSDQLLINLLSIMILGMVGVIFIAWFIYHNSEYKPGADLKNSYIPYNSRRSTRIRERNRRIELINQVERAKNPERYK